MAILVNNIGYLFQLRSTTQEAYITSLKFSYFGRVWITLFLFLFTIKFCKVKVPHLLKNFLVILHIAIYISILTMTEHTLYYSWFKFTTEGLFPKLIHGNGIMHHIYIGLQVLYITVGFTWLFIAWSKEKRQSEKNRFMAVIVAFLIECIFFMIKMFNILEIASEYDMTIFGYLISIIFMFIAFFRYDLLGAKEIARDFIIDRLSEGIIAVDTKGKVQYCNKPALEMYPNMEDDYAKIIQEIKEAISTGKSISVNKRIYTAEENDLLRNNESFGKLYVLIDATEHYERFKKEKKILQRELRIDPMTGLYNRKGMEYFSDQLYNEALEKGKALFVCICDMNGLKYINDNFGHDEGDRAIRMLSQIILESLEEGDFAFRIGGDEFLILGLRSDEGSAEASFREKTESVIEVFNKAVKLPYKIDMSYGPLAKTIDGNANEFSDLLKQSDNLMYQMKKRRDKHIR